MSTLLAKSHLSFFQPHPISPALPPSLLPSLSSSLSLPLALISLSPPISLSCPFSRFPLSPSTFCGCLLLYFCLFTLQIGAGTVLSDLINSRRFPVVKLTKIHRQEHGSNIIQFAHNILTGGLTMELPSNLSCENDVVFLEANRHTAGTQIVNLVCNELPKIYDLHPQTIQVLCPSKQGHSFSVGELNKCLQAHLNPGSNILRMNLQGQYQEFRHGDKVMHVKNNYHQNVFNGEIGFITSINRKLSSPTALTVTFSGRKKQVMYELQDLAEQLTLAYATTIHKAQGCEFPVVVIPIFLANLRMLNKHLLYTAVTRARQCVVLVGELAALKACLIQEPEREWSPLLQLLADNDSRSMETSAS
eukprot:m.106441 g.106441  ORF g.106441 m.106441 type:complete len:361 (-) comp22540_c0_seq4:307-1389(-)